MKTLVVAPHPDDELLGCGGTLLRRKAEGASLGWLIVTGITQGMGWSKEQVKQREEEIAHVTLRLGVDRVYKLGLPTMMLDTFPMSDLIQMFSKVFQDFEPEEVFIPHISDVHTDHRVVFNAASSCCKWFRYPFIRRVLAYETLSETEIGLNNSSKFNPNVYIDISDFLDGKLELLKIYKSEISKFPFPRSIIAVQALAQLRGSTAGFLAAESFELLSERLNYKK